MATIWLLPTIGVCVLWFGTVPTTPSCGAILLHSVTIWPCSLWTSQWPSQHPSCPVPHNIPAPLPAPLPGSTWILSGPRIVVPQLESLSQSDLAPCPMSGLCNFQTLGPLLPPSDLIPSSPTSFFNLWSVNTALTSRAPQCLASMYQEFHIPKISSHGFPLPHPTATSCLSLLTTLLTSGLTPCSPFSIPAIFKKSVECFYQYNITNHVSPYVRMHIDTSHMYIYIYTDIYIYIHIHMYKSPIHTHTYFGLEIIHTTKTYTHIYT